MTSNTLMVNHPVDPEICCLMSQRLAVIYIHNMLIFLLFTVKGDLEVHVLQLRH